MSDKISNSGRYTTDTTYLNLTGQDIWGDLGSDLDELSPEERRNIVELDRQLHSQWGLGRNFILGWNAVQKGIQILVLPHYTVAEYAFAVRFKQTGDTTGTHAAADFVMGLLGQNRQLDNVQMANAARLLEVDPVKVAFTKPLSGTSIETRVIEKLVTRYGVSYVEGRAVALFDIVGFSLLSPFEQMTQLNSLSYSLNSSHSKMLDREVNINFTRSSTGDGFYIWNRDLGVSANTNLYHLMHLTLADNAIARNKANGRTVPLLRTAFHIGSCYEYHQSAGLNPTVFSDIVGDVTIDLARMSERSAPGQVLVGDFHVTIPADETNPAVELDAVAFVEHAQASLLQLNGLVLAGEEVESIKCYLTGEPHEGAYSIRKLGIQDKHGFDHSVFNAKINIHRSGAEPIFLGIEDQMLRGDDVGMKTTGYIMPTTSH